MMKYLILIIHALLLHGCASSQYSAIEYVVQNANSFDNRNVTVEGILVLDFEDINLYASKKEAREQINIDTKCISLSVTPEIYEKWKLKSGDKVVVTGKLDANFCSKDEVCPSSCNEVGLTNIAITEDKKITKNN